MQKITSFPMPTIFQQHLAVQKPTNYNDAPFSEPWKRKSLPSTTCQTDVVSFSSNLSTLPEPTDNLPKFITLEKHQLTKAGKHTVPTNALIQEIATAIQGADQPGGVVLEGIEPLFNFDYRAIEIFLHQLCIGLYQHINNGKDPDYCSNNPYYKEDADGAGNTGFHTDGAKLTEENANTRVLWYPSLTPDKTPVNLKKSTFQLFHRLKHQQNPAFQEYPKIFSGSGLFRSERQALLDALTPYAPAIDTTGKVFIWDDRLMLHCGGSETAGARPRVSITCY